MSIASKRRDLKKQAYKSGGAVNAAFPVIGLLFYDMAKDFFDFKRYKSRSHVEKEFLTPLRGLGNLVLSLGSALISCLMPIVVILLLITNTPKENVFRALKACIGLPLLSITYAIRGLTQLAATPLTWLRMIGKGIYTAVKGGWQSFKYNNGTQRLVSEGEKILNEKNENNRQAMSDIFTKLYHKVEKAREQGQPIDIDPSFDVEQMNVCSGEKYQAWSFFKATGANQFAPSLSEAGRHAAEETLAYFKTSSANSR